MRTRKPGQGSVVPPEKEAADVEKKSTKKSGPQPMRFLLLKGTFNDKGGKYSTGDYVETYRELDVLFTGKKFRRITDPNALSTPIPDRRETGFHLRSKGVDIYDVVNTTSGEVINKDPLNLDEARGLEQASGAPFAKMPQELFNLLHKDMQERLKETDSLKR